jgi:ribonuclease HI
MTNSKREEKIIKAQELIDRVTKSGLLMVFTDGSGDNSNKDNPIKFGFEILENGKVIHSESAICSEKNNSSVKSEILAINAALSFLISEGATEEEIHFFTDNTFMVQYCFNKNWRSRSVNKPYYKSQLEMNDLLQNFSNIKYHWIPRELNERADALTR